MQMPMESRLPEPDVDDPFPELAAIHRVDPMILWGAWPDNDQGDDELSRQDAIEE
jgi:hypothetical protein